MMPNSWLACCVSPWLTLCTCLQETKDWLAADSAKGAADPAEVGPQTPDKPGGTPWGEARADASWDDSPDKDHPELLHDYGLGDVLDDESDFTVVVRKKNKKGRQQAGSGIVNRGRGHRNY